MRPIFAFVLVALLIASLASAQETTCSGVMSQQRSTNDVCYQAHEWLAGPVDTMGNNCVSIIDYYYTITGGWGYDIMPPEYGTRLSYFVFSGFSWMSNPRECFDVNVYMTLTDPDTELTVFDGNPVMNYWCADNCCVGGRCDQWTTLPRFRMNRYFTLAQMRADYGPCKVRRFRLRL